MRNLLRGRCFWYWAPGIRCKTQNGRPGCKPIPLPYPELPANRTGEVAWPWPPDDWVASFACRDCNRILEYIANDVHWYCLPKKSAGKYQSNANCFSVEFPCSDPGCAAPVRFYVDMCTENELALKRELNAVRFEGTCPKGHAIGRPNMSELRIRRIKGPLPAS